MSCKMHRSETTADADIPTGGTNVTEESAWLAIKAEVQSTPLDEILNPDALRISPDVATSKTRRRHDGAVQQMQILVAHRVRNCEIRSGNCWTYAIYP